MSEKREWLIKYREKRRLSQLDVAKLVDVTQQHYGYIENGLRRPSPQVAQKIAKILNFDWTKFYSKTEKHQKNKNENFIN